MSINSTEDIIQNQDARLRVESSRKSNAPLLATTQVNTTGSNFGQVTLWQDSEIGVQSGGVDCISVALLFQWKAKEDVVSDGGIL